MRITICSLNTEDNVARHHSCRPDSPTFAKGILHMDMCLLSLISWYRVYAMDVGGYELQHWLSSSSVSGHLPLYEAVTYQASKIANT